MEAHGARSIEAVSSVHVAAYIGAGTRLAEGKATREINVRPCVLEQALPSDLVEAWQADRCGNLTFRASGRNFNPIMASAGRVAAVQVQHRAGVIDPEVVSHPASSSTGWCTYPTAIRRVKESDMAEASMSWTPLTRKEMAQRVAQDIPEARDRSSSRPFEVGQRVM